MGVSGEDLDIAAEVLIDGRPARYSAVCLPDVKPGDWVVVHSGYLVRRVPPPGPRVKTH